MSKDDDNQIMGIAATGEVLFFSHGLLFSFFVGIIGGIAKRGIEDEAMHFCSVL